MDDGLTDAELCAESYAGLRPMGEWGSYAHLTEPLIKHTLF